MNATADSNWYCHETVGDGVTLIWESPLKPFYRCNIWHVCGRDGDLLIDTGMGLRPLAPIVATMTEKPVLAVASHGHVDHIGGHYEFPARAVHAAEAETLASPNRRNTIAEPYLTNEMFECGPMAGFDVATYCARAAPATRMLQDGDIIDLGDRAFEVIHVPGHSPGSIALWEAETATLFSGDTVYDGPLIDDFYHSVVADYLASMERLRRLPVRIVHAGHFASFGRERFVALIDEYVSGKRKAGCIAFPR